MRFTTKTNNVFQTLQLRHDSLREDSRNLVDLLNSSHLGRRQRETSRHFILLLPQDRLTALTSIHAELLEIELKMFLWFGYRVCGSKFDVDSHQYTPSVETLPAMNIPAEVLSGEVPGTMPMRFADYQTPTLIHTWLEENSKT